jgi:hypothetical protein
MNDEGIQNKIEQLVQEEHSLLELDGQSRSADKHERLTAIEVDLDNPDDASVRDAGTVEGYLQ